MVQFMTDNDDLVQKIGNLIDQKLEPIKNDLQAVKHVYGLPLVALPSF